MIQLNRTFNVFFISKIFKKRVDKVTLMLDTARKITQNTPLIPSVELFLYSYRITRSHSIALTTTSYVVCPGSSLVRFHSRTKNPLDTAINKLYFIEMFMKNVGTIFYRRTVKTSTRCCA